MKTFNSEEFLTNLDTKLTTINLDCSNNSANITVKKLFKLFRITQLVGFFLT